MAYIGRFLAVDCPTIFSPFTAMASTNTDRIAVDRKATRLSTSNVDNGDNAQSQSTHYAHQPINMAALQTRLQAVSADEARRARFPLHWFVENEPDDATISSIHRRHAADPSVLHEKDGASATLLHMTTSKCRPEVLTELLSLGGIQDLNQVDERGRTPLGALELTMKVARELRKQTGTPFEGCGEAACRCKLVILKATGSRLLEGASDEELLKRIKWGCTCEKCIDSQLSPSMLFRLQSQCLLFISLFCRNL